MNKTLLFDFYQQLMFDKEWVNPGLEGYYLLWQLLENPDFRPTNFHDLAHTLETIWVKSQQQQRRFRQLLEDRRQQLVEALRLWQEQKDQPAVDPLVQTPVIEKPIVTETGNLPSEQTRTTDSIATSNQPTIEKRSDDKVETVSDRQLEDDSAPGFSISHTEAAATEAFTLQQKYEKNNLSEVDRPFFFTNDYFPIRNRQLQQAWRTLKVKREAAEGDTINIARTIGHTARQGYFNGFVYDRNATNQLKLFLLIDESDSMIAVESFGREIGQAAAASEGFTGLEPLYFNTLPQKNAKANDYGVSFEAPAPNTTLGKLFATHARKDIVVMVYSDAGTLRNEYDERRITQTTEFIRWLHQRSSYIAWLNPAPRHRWADTNAAVLQNEVPMFEPGREAFENAVAVLKGKIVHQSIMTGNYATE